MVPEDIVRAARAACDMDDPLVGLCASEEVVAAAILAERKRSADVARKSICVANSILESGDSFSEAHWNGRLFASEWILSDIEAGA